MCDDDPKNAISTLNSWETLRTVISKVVNKTRVEYKPSNTVASLNTQNMLAQARLCSLRFVAA